MIRSFLLLLISFPLLASGKDKALESGRKKMLSDFGKVIILDQGRQKPLDTYARSVLLQFSGRQRIGAHSAMEWMGRLFFDPSSTREETVFLINNSEVVDAVGVAASGRRYSFAQLEPGFKKLSELSEKIRSIEEKERSAVESEILRVYGNLTLYVNLAASFQFAIPHMDFTISDSSLAAVMGLPANEPLSYLDLFLNAEKLHGILDTLKDSQAANWSPAERSVLSVTQRMFQWSNFYQGIPILFHPTNSHGEEVWFSSWDGLNNAALLPHLRDEIQLLGQMLMHYRKKDPVAFSLTVREFQENLVERAGEKVKLADPGLELFYNKAQVFFLDKVLYAAGGLISLLGLLFWPRGFHRLASILVLAAFALHTFGISSRMIIMDRPPVTNLYETFLFVGWISVLLGLIVEWFQKKGLGLLVSSVSGFAMMMIAGKYFREGDTMGMLVAVLDSNFWLSTHVVTITMGYAGVCAAGVAGHIYILQLFFSKDPIKLKETFRAVYGIMAFGLVLSFVGTVLGGIWADQSWGRFWGWDPKENGALLIVLWCAILFHSRMGGMIREFGFSMGSIFGILVVMFAWFGVNLLGVGLHSYGFTSGVFINLMVYVCLETTFMAAAGIWYVRKKSLTLKN